MPLFGLSFETLPFALSPLCFFPEFTWETPKNRPIATKIPPTPKPAHWVIRRFWGFVHKKILVWISLKYCKWMELPRDIAICQLPFGLVLKRSDGTRLEEVLTMKITRSAGLPVPRVISYGDHPEDRHAPVSILMTRMPGNELQEAIENEHLSPQQETVIKGELRGYLEAMRYWSSPWGPSRICSVSGTALRSVRIPFGEVPACEDEKHFHDYLIEPTSNQGFESVEDFEETLDKAKHMQTLSHRIVFTHGDFLSHNILVRDGHVSALLDWEASGWYPDYWEFTTGCRM